MVRRVPQVHISRNRRRCVSAGVVEMWLRLSIPSSVKTIADLLLGVELLQGANGQFCSFMA